MATQTPNWLRSGRLAQLVEHLVYTERVGSSSLSAPTIFSGMYLIYMNVVDCNFGHPL